MTEFKPFWQRKYELTATEKELLEMKRRYTNRQIAELKGIKENSVSFMMWKINKKLKGKYERKQSFIPN